MRTSILGLLVLLVGGCAKSPTVVKANLDPWWGLMLYDSTLTRYPDTAIVVVNWTVLRPADSLPMFTDSLTITQSTTAAFISIGCGEVTQGSGDPNAYLLRAQLLIIVGPRANINKRPVVGHDTLARYTMGVWNPTLSPLPGWGDDQDHIVVWRFTLNNATPVAPTPILPLPETQGTPGDGNWGVHCNAPGQQIRH